MHLAATSLIAIIVAARDHQRDSVTGGEVSFVKVERCWCLNQVCAQTLK
jgi:hypothetical protein